MKSFIIFCFLVLYNVSVCAQEFQAKTSIGINQGISISELFSSPNLPQSYVSGLSGGIIIKHQSEPHLGIQVEVNYIQKAWNLKDEANMSIFSNNVTYIEIPLMTNLELGKKRTKIAFNLGPHVAVLLSDKIVNNIDQQFEFPTRINSIFELGIHTGTALIRETKLGIFQLDARYFHSLTNVFEANDTSVFSSSQIRGAILKLSYLIQI